LAVLGLKENRLLGLQVVSFHLYQRFSALRSRCEFPGGPEIPLGHATLAGA
jgi:hypothetical protein